MAKQYGLAEAQHQWFITINGRYSSNFLMSLNSFVYGSVISYKLWPIIAVVAWVVAFYNLINLALGNVIAPWQKVSAALFFTAIFYTNMPGIHEGAYWLSSITGYQLPTISFLFLLPICVKFNNRPTLFGGVVLFCLSIIIAGFHEMIALMATILAFYFAIQFWLRKKQVLSGYTIVMLGAGLAVLAQVLSVGNRYKADITLARKDWSTIECVARGILQTCYHILTRGLLSPSFWLGAIFVFFITYKFQAEIKKNVRIPTGKNMVGMLIIAAFMVFFPGVLLVYIENKYAAMRIMNVAYLAFLVGFYIATAMFAIRTNNNNGLEKYSKLAKHRNWAAALLLALMVVFSGNIKLATGIIADGAAYKYNKEVNERFAKIEACKANVCQLDCLADQPLILCPVDACQDPTFIGYLEKVFGKKLVENK